MRQTGSTGAIAGRARCPRPARTARLDSVGDVLQHGGCARLRTPTKTPSSSRVALYGAYVPVRDFLGDGVLIDAADVAVGVTARALRAGDDVTRVRGTWLAPDCRRQLDGGEMIARRARRELRSPLRLRGCSFAGSVALTSRGRWFVYVSLRDDDRRAESWLPVHNAADGDRVVEAGRYAYEPPEPGSSSLLKYAGSAVLYAGMAALLLMTIAVLRLVGP